ncbi:rsbT co-antagonist protein RsbR [Bacillus oleivorans]|uniref:histidine kinase n=1 Tax=Bacillus oleivorans TaxID=1448271 RepID=A0A285CQL6_9BACI|nr:ATP-binding protein [Bacillus oleivorans]SNX69847.1 rsbT co-antagonist protein RsbR [Bacillus oleivorans]
MTPNDENQEERNKHNHLSQLASVGQIAAGIAHEVRNPLTAVKGFLQLLQNEDKPEYIEIAQSELDNALTTLNNLLQVSKPDLEDEEEQPIHMAVELESVLNLFQDRLYDVELITDIQDSETVVFGKKNQFKKAFFNLLKNAFESIEGKGKIWVSHFAAEKEVIVSIQDTGVGIPKEKLAILGTPFFTTKHHGTGMGLTQVFTVVYQHGGNISVESKENEGTKFTLTIPKKLMTNPRGVKRLELEFEKDFTMIEFFKRNSKIFEDRLLDQAINVRDKIDEILAIGNIDLINNAQKLVILVIEEREHELITFAKQEGKAWAKYSLTIAFKLEWVQAIRRTLWDFLYNFTVQSDNEHNLEDFFTLEKKINELMDQFLNHFFISYSKFKDEVLLAQRELVENLSVPIIPITPSISILPLIGEMDEYRIKTIEEKVLEEISELHIQTIIMDLSGVGYMELEVMQHLIKIIDGISLMGCKTVLTGIRPEIVKNVVKSGISLEKKATAKGTLQLALRDYLGLKKE